MGMCLRALCLMRLDPPMVVNIFVPLRRKLFCSYLPYDQASSCLARFDLESETNLDESQPNVIRRSI